MTAYETALREQIAYLEAELARYAAEQELQATHDGVPGDDDPPIAWALKDPGFRKWLLKRQLEREVRG